jgi:hypothetical protein
MDNAGVVVDHLEAATGFFVEFGLALRPDLGRSRRYTIATYRGRHRPEDHPNRL